MIDTQHSFRTNNWCQLMPFFLPATSLGVGYDNLACKEIYWASEDGFSTLKNETLERRSPFSSLDVVMSDVNGARMATSLLL